MYGHGYNRTVNSSYPYKTGKSEVISISHTAEGVFVSELSGTLSHLEVWDVNAHLHTLLSTSLSGYE
jgi:hypothetical protein